MDQKFSTLLTDEQYNSCIDTAYKLLDKQPKLQNKDIREAADIGYDQAIAFFKRATQEQKLIRQGTGSGTYYVKPNTVD